MHTRGLSGLELDLLDFDAAESLRWVENHSQQRLADDGFTLRMVM